MNGPKIYMKYMIWIWVYSIIIFTLVIKYGQLLESIFPSFDETKPRVIVLIEIYMQVALISVGVYVFREIIDWLLRLYFLIDKKPGSFATVIIGSSIFSQQKVLVNKINYVFKK